MLLVLSITYNRTYIQGDIEALMDTLDLQYYEECLEHKCFNEQQKQQIQEYIKHLNNS